MSITCGQTEVDLRPDFGLDYETESHGEHRALRTRSPKTQKRAGPSQASLGSLFLQKEVILELNLSVRAQNHEQNCSIISPALVNYSRNGWIAGFQWAGGSLFEGRYGTKFAKHEDTTTHNAVSHYIALSIG